MSFGSRPAATLCLVAGALLTTASGVAAQTAPDAGATDNVIKFPQGELREMFKDDTFQIEFVLPATMTAYSPEELEMVRGQTIAPEFRYRPPTDDPDTAQDEKPDMQPHVQLFMFRDEQGGTLRVQINRPPVLSIDSTTTLEAAVVEPDRLANRPVKGIGEPGMFRTRDGRTALLFEREFGLQPGAPRTHRQASAFMRSNDRSVLAQYTSPIEFYDEGRDDFVAAMGTFAIKDGRRVTFADLVPARRPKVASAGTIANALLGAAALVFLVYILRHNIRRGDSSASGGSATTP